MHSYMKHISSQFGEIFLRVKVQAGPAGINIDYVNISSVLLLRKFVCQQFFLLKEANVKDNEDKN